MQRMWMGRVNVREEDEIGREKRSSAEAKWSRGDLRLPFYILTMSRRVFFTHNRINLGSHVANSLINVCLSLWGCR